MRIDDFLSTVGVIKRRTVAKELGASGLIFVNGNKIKPSYKVKLGDVIQVKGNKGVTVEVLELPTGSVPKEKRERYFKELPGVL